jgi:site-specific recombinase XerD
MISTNPAVLVDLPKLHEKPIVRLEPNEIVDLLNSIENGEQLTSGQKKYYDKNHRRDLSMIALLLGTGIRISECVGLNISDFDMQNNSFRVIRKGGTQTILFLPEEVKNLLIDYLQTDRYALIPIDEYSQDAIFLSLQKRRMTVSAVEKMQKNIQSMCVPLKNILSAQIAQHVRNQSLQRDR